MNAKKNLVVGVVAFLVILGVLIYAGGLWPGNTGGPRLPSIKIGGPFALEAGDGSTVTDRTYRDKWQLIYFGYTLCPDACPTALSDIAGAMTRLGPLAQKVQPIFITIDPARDTPKVMAEYVKAFGGHIIGLSGTPEQIADAAREFRVYYAKVKDKDAPNGYLMDHSSVIYVMRPGDFDFVATFTHETSSDQMAERLRKLITSS
ncbi:MAG TPA: SCO family protein [Stellaceae bacterium]|nr:SCO family protein [Stellaceae bacterium]